MRSRSGFLAALLLFIAFPLAVLCQIVFGAGADTVVHVVGGVGFALLARSFFDFALPRWVVVAGATSAAGMGVIFLLQALSTVLPSEPLHAVAFDLLGDLPEFVLIAGLLAGLFAACLQISRGAMRWLGLLTVLIVAGLQVWRFYARSSEIPQPAELRLLYLLPFVWLLVESRRPQTEPSVGTLAA